MSRPWHVAKVVWAILALTVPGCDSLLGEPRSSADGGGCGVIYIYLDGGAPTAVDGSSQAGEGGGESTVDVADLSAAVDGPGGAQVDVMPALDEGHPNDVDFQDADGAVATPYDTSRDLLRDAPGDTSGHDALIQDTVRDLLGADSVDLPRDSALPKQDVAADVADSPSGPDVDAPLVSDVPAGPGEVDGSDVRDASAGLDQGSDGPAETSSIDRSPALPDGPPSPVDVNGPVVVARISTGSYHSCALRNDAIAYCWGEDLAGQSAPPLGVFFAQVDSAYYSNCGVKLDRTLACWGGNNQGQTTPPSGEFLQVAMGSLHACGIQVDGTVVCWGYNGFGQSNAPAGTFVQLSAGHQHTCGIQTNGSTVCWGGDGSGQSTVPLGEFVEVSSRRLHTCALRTDHAVACWGSNSYGESTPPSGAFVQVTAGYFHACGIRDNGTVTCWGSDSYGQSTPPSGTFLQLSAEDNHTCGVRNDGTVTCWGSDSSGQSSPP